MNYARFNACIQIPGSKESAIGSSAYLSLFRISEQLVELKLQHPGAHIVADGVQLARIDLLQFHMTIIGS